MVDKKIQEFIDFLKIQAGIICQVDDYFNTIQEHNGNKYFCLDLKENIWLSNNYNIIERLSKSNRFTVEPAGQKRIAIFLKGL